MEPLDHPADPLRGRYNRIGVGYAARRRPEPAWTRQILTALGDAATVVNVGAGTGNYEPADRSVVAVEPSETMIEQRPATSAPVLRGVAESLPFADNTFDAATALLTVHHWSDIGQGLAELRRVSRRQVLHVFDTEMASRFWLLDYFPDWRDMENDERTPTPELVAQHLDVVDVQVLAVPRLCTDGVAAAHWCRPRAYLDPLVRQSISSLALLAPDALERGVSLLEQDLDSGRWNKRWSHLLEQDEADFGYRLVIAESS